MNIDRNIALAVCAVLAALILLLTSQSSPLYPINLWGDANCLFTVGRVMKDGGVLYRDIYEQTGPLLYLIHALAACLSDTSFSGVYLMEIPALTAALYAAYRLLRLRAGSAFALGAAAVFAAQSTVALDCSVARCRTPDPQLSPLFVTRMIRYVSGTPW